MKFRIIVLSIYIVSCTPPQRDRQKLEIINQTLEQMVEIQILKRKDVLNEFKEEIRMQGTPLEALRALEQAQSFYPKTKALLLQIDSLKIKLKQQSRLSKDEISPLEQSLEEYLAYIDQNLKDFITHEISYLTTKSYKQDFYTYYFAYKSKDEINLYLNQLKFWIHECNQEVFKWLGFRGYIDFVEKFCSARPLAIATSVVIIQGEDYNADLVYEQCNTYEKYKIIFNGDTLQKRHIAIPTPNQGIFPWEVLVYKDLGDRDSVFHLKGKYEVIPK